jgi:hypothetical protein
LKPTEVTTAIRFYPMAIDQIVYRLYDLSAEEIRVVEGKEKAK